MQSILDLFVPQAVHNGVQQGGDDCVGHREESVLPQRTLGLGLEVDDGSAAIVDDDTAVGPTPSQQLGGMDVWVPKVCDLGGVAQRPRSTTVVEEHGAPAAGTLPNSFSVWIKQNN